MVQDIYPKELHNEYVNKTVSKESVIFAFREDTVLCSNNDKSRFPLHENLESSNCECIYLFEIDGIDYFLAKDENIKVTPEYDYSHINVFRSKMLPQHLAFAGLTAYHLYKWYRDNKFCGRCGNVLERDTKERALVCKKCGNCIYPKISPVVIVGVVNRNHLLMTKYANREYAKYALIAGFIEIGENAEGAVRREVMEEVGIKIKNITYYKSQPWGLSDSLLFGYFAELDGEQDLHIEEDELSEAVWIERESITTEADNFSLTNEMICKFKNQMKKIS